MERCVASDESTRKCRYTASRVTLRLNVIERTSVAPDFPDLPLVQEEVPGFNDALVSMTRRPIFCSCMSIALLTLQGLYPVSLMVSATSTSTSPARQRIEESLFIINHKYKNIRFYNYIITAEIKQHKNI
ncbi:unnamed protein product [Lasius platythorax]|uniref:Uncharacterized protein n=1 Tax=Lasius platythorax TaxID=488582 RepID=A0AAV2NZB4_9HYME